MPVVQNLQICTEPNHELRTNLNYLNHVDEATRTHKTFNFTNFKFTENPGIEKLNKLLHKKSNSTINEETFLVNSKTVKLDDLCESEKILIRVNFKGSESIFSANVPN